MGPVDQLEEALSALCDGELDGEARNELLQHLCNDPELKQRWQSYHLIRDALSNNLPSEFSVDLSQQIMQIVDAEPMHSATDSGESIASRVIQASDRFIKSKSTVAVPPSGRQLLLKRLAGFAIAASVASVALISYQVGLQQRDPELAKQDVAPASPTQMATINGVTVMASPVSIPQKHLQPVESQPVFASSQNQFPAPNRERVYGNQGANSLPNVTRSQTLPQTLTQETQSRAEMERNRKLNQYLMDHNQAYSNSRLQGMFPYARIMMVPGRTQSSSQPTQAAQPSQLTQPGR